MSKCCLCKKEIDSDECDYEEMSDSINEQVDHFGMQSLTENEQLFYEGKMCLECC